MGFKGLSWHGILDGPCMLILDCHGSKLPLPKLKSKLCGNNFHFGYLGVGARGLNVLAKCGSKLFENNMLRGHNNFLIFPFTV